MGIRHLAILFQNIFELILLRSLSDDIDGDLSYARSL